MGSLKRQAVIITKFQKYKKRKRKRENQEMLPLIKAMN